MVPSLCSSHTQWWLDHRSCRALEGLPPAVLKSMPQGLSRDGKVKHQSTLVLFLRNTHISVTVGITCGCSFIRSHIRGCRGAGSKQQDIFVALTKGGENCCVQPVGWGDEQRNRPC